MNDKDSQLELPLHSMEKRTYYVNVYYSESNPKLPSVGSVFEDERTAQATGWGLDNYFKTISFEV